MPSSAAGVSDGVGAYAPMPPVFGPRSSSCARLKSRAGGSSAQSRPSHTAITDASSPARKRSSTTRRPLSSKRPDSRQSRTNRSASARSSLTSTPLPAASPSALTTQRGPEARSSCPARRRPRARTPRRRRSGIARRDTHLPRTTARFEARGIARGAEHRHAGGGERVGPSTSPAASVSRTASRSKRRPMPSLPGATSTVDTSGSRARRHASACSRPPAPTTSTRREVTGAI